MSSFKEIKHEPRQDWAQTSTGVGHHYRPGYYFPDSDFQVMGNEIFIMFSLHITARKATQLRSRYVILLIMSTALGLALGLNVLEHRGLLPQDYQISSQTSIIWSRHYLNLWAPRALPHVYCLCEIRQNNKNITKMKRVGGRTKIAIFLFKFQRQA